MSNVISREQLLHVVDVAFGKNPRYEDIRKWAESAPKVAYRTMTTSDGCKCPLEGGVPDWRDLAIDETGVCAGVYAYDNLMIHLLGFQPGNAVEVVA